MMNDQVKSQRSAWALPPRYEVIVPSPSALNAYQLKGFNLDKKNNECLKSEKETCKAIKEYQKPRRGLKYTHYRGNGNSSTKCSLYKSAHGDEPKCGLACQWHHDHEVNPMPPHSLILTLWMVSREPLYLGTRITNRVLWWSSHT